MLRHPLGVLWDHHRSPLGVLDYPRGGATFSCRAITDACAGWLLEWNRGQLRCPGGFGGHSPALMWFCTPDPFGPCGGLGGHKLRRLVLRTESQHGRNTAKQLNFLAHHEASHAAVAFSFRLQENWIKFGLSRKRTDGGVTLTGGRAKRTDMQRLLIARVAGARAERYLNLRRPVEGSDLDEVRALKLVAARLLHLEGRSQDYMGKGMSA